MIFSDEEILVKVQELSYLAFQDAINSPEVSGTHLFLKEHVPRLKFWIITGILTSGIKRIVESRNMISYFLKCMVLLNVKFNEQISKHHLDSSESLFIGDAIEDQQATQNIGPPFIIEILMIIKTVFLNIQTLD